MLTLHDLAGFLTKCLDGTSGLPPIRFPIKVTKKGGLPAQTAKRIVLERLIRSFGEGALKNVKGDTYSLDTPTQQLQFRLAVTASANTFPWFNITEQELTKLTDNKTLLLVIWNPPDEHRWCKELILFAIPPDD